MLGGSHLTYKKAYSIRGENHRFLKTKTNHPPSPPSPPADNLPPVSARHEVPKQPRPSCPCEARGAEAISSFLSLRGQRCRSSLLLPVLARQEVPKQSPTSCPCEARGAEATSYFLSLRGKRCRSNLLLPVLARQEVPKQSPPSWPCEARGAEAISSFLSLRGKRCRSNLGGAGEIPALPDSLCSGASGHRNEGDRGAFRLQDGV